MTYRLLLLAHLLGVLIWVGGMFFAHMALRPAIAALDPPQRLALMARVLGRFFAWVEWAIVFILGSGIVMLNLLGGARGMFAVPAYLHVMLAVGALMMAIFGHIRFAMYKRLAAAVTAGDWAAAAPLLARIRKWVGINLWLGLFVVVVAILQPGVATMV